MNRLSIIIRGPRERERIIELARSIADGWRVEFKAAKRSDEQNAKLWACLSEISKQVEWYGQHLSAEDWKDMFTASLRRARVVPGIDAGTYVPLGMRTSDMSKQEFSDLLELIHAFAAERGVSLGEEAAVVPGAA